MRDVKYTPPSLPKPGSLEVSVEELLELDSSKKVLKIIIGHGRDQGMPGEKLVDYLARNIDSEYPGDPDYDKVSKLSASSLEAIASRDRRFAKETALLIEKALGRKYVEACVLSRFYMDNGTPPK
ncbi:MAG: hypothetical protein V1702_00385 [Candidatus Woesearchaeota archaeon]